MENINIERTGNGTFIVKADTERFGIQEIMFEGSSIDECENYIRRETTIPGSEGEGFDTAAATALRAYEAIKFVEAFSEGTDKAWKRYRKLVNKYIDKVEEKYMVPINRDAVFGAL